MEILTYNYISIFNRKKENTSLRTTINICLKKKNRSHDPHSLRTRIFFQEQEANGTRRDLPGRPVQAAASADCPSLPWELLHLHFTVLAAKVPCSPSLTFSMDFLGETSGV